MENEKIETDFLSVQSKRKVFRSKVHGTRSANYERVIVIGGLASIFFRLLLP